MDLVSTTLLHSLEEFISIPTATKCSKVRSHKSQPGGSNRHWLAKSERSTCSKGHVNWIVDQYELILFAPVQPLTSQLPFTAFIPGWTYSIHLSEYQQRQTSQRLVQITEPAAMKLNKNWTLAFLIRARKKSLTGLSDFI